MDLKVNKFYEYCFGTSTYLHEARVDCDECPHPKECKAAHMNSIAEEPEKLKKVMKTRAEEILPSDTTTGDSEEAVIRAGSNEWVYTFPDMCAISLRRTTEELYQILHRMIEHPDYFSVRAIYCSIQIELNRSINFRLREYKAQGLGREGWRLTN